MFGNRYATAVFAAPQSAFDPDSFANTSYDGANDTKYIPIPAKEYPGVSKKIAFRHDSEKDYTILDITWGIDSQEVKEITGRDQPEVRQSIFLECTSAGSLDMGKGKNVKLGLLREAVGLNTPGQPFNFNMLVGRPALLKIKHRQHEGDTFAEVDKVTRLG